MCAISAEGHPYDHRHFSAYPDQKSIFRSTRLPQFKRVFKKFGVHANRRNSIRIEAK